MGLFDSLFGSNKTVQAKPLLLPEQQKALASLLNYGQQGFSPYDFSGYSTQTSPYEQAGLSGLQSLLGGQGITTARNRLTDLANTEFNPDDPSSGFAAYSRQVAKATKDAEDVLNREAAITGSRYGSRIVGEKGNLALQQSDLLATKLAELFNQSQNRSLQASQGLGNLAGLEGNILSQLISQGGLERDLQNQKSLLQYNDIQANKDRQLGALSGVLNRNVDYGVTSQDVYNPGLLSTLLSPIATGFGDKLGSSLYDKLFKNTSYN